MKSFTDLDDFVNAAPSLLKNGNNVLAACLRFVCDASFHQIAVLVRRYAAGYECEASSDYGLAL